MGSLVCMDAHMSCHCVCVFVCVCVLVTVCQEEDAQHAFCPPLCLLFALHYPAVTGLCWNAVCVSASTSACLFQQCGYVYTMTCMGRCVSAHVSYVSSVTLKV